jgi:hypothetical protein
LSRCNSTSTTFGKGARFGGRLLLLGSLATLQPAARAAEAAPETPVAFYFLTEVLAKSEPDAIMNAVDGWHGAYGSGRRQYAWSWGEAGVRGDHWGIGGLIRWDYDLRFNEEAAALYGAVQNKRNLPVGQNYNVAVQAHVIHAAGARASWRGDLIRDFKAEFGLSLLRSNYMMEGTLQGIATVTGPKSYTYSATADYAYTKDVLFDRAVSPQDGIGFSLDASFDWKLPPDWRVQAQVRDFPGAIWWKNLPYTQASATSDRSSTDGQGFTHWSPLVSGLESKHRTYRQNLPARGSMEVSYLGWEIVPTLGVNAQFGDWLPKVGLASARGSWSLGGWCWPTTRALGVEVGHGAWKVGISMDNLQWGLMKAFNLTLACRP